MGSFWDDITGQTNFNANDFNADKSGNALKQFERLRDPRFLLPYNLKVASNASPSRSTLLQIAQATGGSQGAANAQAEALGRSAQEQAVMGYDASTLQAQGLANNALGMDIQNQQFINQSLYDQEKSNAESVSSLFNNALGIGGTLAGNYFGGGGSFLDLLGLGKKTDKRTNVGDYPNPVLFGNNPYSQYS